jgi:hypothetical protein
MPRSFDKLAVDLKLMAQVEFVFLYVGARSIWRQITKATLASSALEAACTGKQPVLYSEGGKSFTFADIRRIGEQVIRGAFAELLRKPDLPFLTEMEGYDAPDERLEDETCFRPLALKILKRPGRVHANIRDSDWENTLKIILISESDLQAGTDEGDSYQFIKTSEPYTVYPEMRTILRRYHHLRRAKATYGELHALFGNMLDRVAADLGYTMRQKTENQPYYDLFDANMEFYKAASKALEETDPGRFLTDEKMKKLQKDYLETLRDPETGDIYHMMNCGKGCGECVFDMRKCVREWIKQLNCRLLRRVCFYDTFTPDPLGLDEDLERGLFNQQYKDIYVFTKK